MCVKQVIVMRKDLGMRKGKMIAQGAHASIGVFFDRIDNSDRLDDIHRHQIRFKNIDFTMRAWMEGIFTKICVGVDSEEELMDISNQAKESGLPCVLIQDAGKTEFKEPTYTCCAIGPAEEDDINKITGELKLL